MREWIIGRHPVYEVLRARRRQPFRLWLGEGSSRPASQETSRLADVISLCERKNIPVERVPRTQLDGLGDGHQGVALQASSYPYCALQDILERASQHQEPAFLLILDTLQDPQNLGTLLRTAEAVGIDGVLLPLRHTATVTPAVVNASSGASEHLLITQCNLAQAINTLKTKNIWVIGLVGEAETMFSDQVNCKLPLALVVGNEGEGIRPLVRKSCDILVRLPMRGWMESLNAAVAGSVALYFIWRERGF